MSVSITQHGNLAGYAKTGVLSAPLSALSQSSAAGSTVAAGAEYIRAVADGGSLIGFAGTALFGSSTATITSTNAMRLPANVPAVLAVPQGATSIICAST